MQSVNEIQESRERRGNGWFNCFERAYEIILVIYSDVEVHVQIRKFVENSNIK